MQFALYIHGFPIDLDLELVESTMEESTDMEGPL